MSICTPHAFAEARTIRAAAIPPPDEGVAALKAYLRVEGGQEDALIGSLIATAVAQGEGFTGCALIARAFTDTLPGDGAWRRLGRGPVVSIVSVASVAADATATPLAIDAYAIDVDAGGDGWVRLTGAGPTLIEIGYTAGIAADWASLPEALRQGVVRLASHLYTHRDAPDEGSPPLAVAALWRPWRRMRLA